MIPSKKTGFNGSNVMINDFIPLEEFKKHLNPQTAEKAHRNIQDEHCAVLT